MKILSKLGLIAAGVIITLLIFYSGGGLRRWEVFLLSIGVTTLAVCGGVMVYNLVASRNKEKQGEFNSPKATYWNRVLYAMIGALITLIIILAQWKLT